MPSKGNERGSELVRLRLHLLASIIQCCPRASPAPNLYSALRIPNSALHTSPSTLPSSFQRIKPSQPIQRSQPSICAPAPFSLYSRHHFTRPSPGSFGFPAIHGSLHSAFLIQQSEISIQKSPPHTLPAIPHSEFRTPHSEFSNQHPPYFPQRRRPPHSARGG